MEDYKVYDEKGRCIGVKRTQGHSDSIGNSIGSGCPKGEVGVEGPPGLDQYHYEIVQTVHYNAVVNTIKACIEHWNINMRNRTWPVMPEIDYKCKQ